MGVLEVQQPQPFGREVVDTGSGCPAQNAATVAAWFSIAEVVGEEKDDVRFARESGCIGLRLRNRGNGDDDADRA